MRVGNIPTECLDCFPFLAVFRRTSHDMTAADLRDAFHLLDSALSVLRGDADQTPEELRRSLRALTREFDLLRLRLGQPAAEEQRN